VAAFLVVVFLGVVVLVCAGSDIELITNIAAIVACSCFVMEPRKILERHKDSRKTVWPRRRLRFSSFCRLVYRPKQM
jgi:hypothetical protein